eukprot:TRINITY_DN4287_c0_g1_i2.p1 TRINITY_DN4287_c0_g1~~TRINITY_DN4287_c0_g1_i2.p1  ORF type:complete len:752 (-),score=98.27 TRINITY_DN4287_c0_g1_i2:137-2392(-)
MREGGYMIQFNSSGTGAPFKTRVMKSANDRPRLVSKSGNNSLVARRRTFSRESLSIPEQCNFCDQNRQGRLASHLNTLVHNALYTKYSSSQNYYYTRDLNDILSDNRSKGAIRFKDYASYDEEEEYLKRSYKMSEYQGKIQALTEYYKFHQEIPRLFMLPETGVLNKFHDRKRRIEYNRITKMLHSEEAKIRGEKGKEEPKKEVVNQKPEIIPSSKLKMPKRKNQPSIGDGRITDRILDNLDMSEGKSTTRQENRPLQKNRVDSSTKKRSEASTKESGRAKQKNMETASNVSNTLAELNMKLGEIISNSRILDNTNQLEMSTELFNNLSVSQNLNNFIKFLRDNPLSASKFSLEGFDLGQKPKSVKKEVAPSPKLPPKQLKPGNLTDREMQKKPQAVTTHVKPIKHETLFKDKEPLLSRKSSARQNADPRVGTVREERALTARDHQKMSTGDDYFENLKNFDEFLRLKNLESEAELHNLKLPKGFALDLAGKGTFRPMISITNVNSRNNSIGKVKLPIDIKRQSKDNAGVKMASQIGAVNAIHEEYATSAQTERKISHRKANTLNHNQLQAMNRYQTSNAPIVQKMVFEPQLSARVREEPIARPPVHEAGKITKSAHFPNGVQSQVPKPNRDEPKLQSSHKSTKSDPRIMKLVEDIPKPKSSHQKTKSTSIFPEERRRESLVTINTYLRSQPKIPTSRNKQPSGSLSSRRESNAHGYQPHSKVGSSPFKFAYTARYDEDAHIGRGETYRKK